MSDVTPLGAVGRGIAAGVAGTALMTAWQELSAKLQRSSAEDGGSPEGSAEPADPWAQAPAPAKVARRVLEGVFERQVAADRIRLLTNVTHWGYGTVWGAVYGLVQGTRRGRAGRAGVLFGAAVWGLSYVQLVPMGLYEPPWKYPPKQLAMDLSYHLAYGAGLGAAYTALDR